MAYGACCRPIDMSNNPYSTSSATIDSESPARNAQSSMPWHTKVVIGILTIAGLLVSTSLIYIVTEIAEPFVFFPKWLLVKLILAPVLLLASAVLLARRNKLAYIPVTLMALPVLTTAFNTALQLMQPNYVMHPDYASAQYRSAAFHNLLLQLSITVFLLGIGAYCFRMRKKQHPSR